MECSKSFKPTRMENRSGDAKCWRGCHEVGNLVEWVQWQFDNTKKSQVSWVLYIHFLLSTLGDYCTRRTRTWVTHAHRGTILNVSEEENWKSNHGILMCQESKQQLKQINQRQNGSILIVLENNLDCKRNWKRIQYDPTYVTCKAILGIVSQKSYVY